MVVTADFSSWYGSFLATLSPREREKVLTLAHTSRCMAGDTIFREGDPSLYLYIVRAGRVAIDIHVPPKGRCTILTVGPGDLFSWSALVEPRIETATARAVEETEVLAIKGGELMDLCREDTLAGFEIYRTLAGVITARLIATRLQLLDALSGG
jgi:CRP-like cAMP-binding protein